MIRLALIFVLLNLHACSCSNISQATASIVRYDANDHSKVVEEREEIMQFHVELSINKKPPVNFYFAIVLINAFSETEDIELILDIIESCRKSPFSSQDAERECCVFKNTLLRKNCQIALDTFYNPYGPCFLQEETDRKSLRQRGVHVINEGNDGIDLLLILNRMRSGVINDAREIMYYAKRFQLYAKLSHKGWKLLLQMAEKHILDECNVDLNDNDPPWF